jgi:hypothetical protein
MSLAGKVRAYRSARAGPGELLILDDSRRALFGKVISQCLSPCARIQPSIYFAYRTTGVVMLKWLVSVLFTLAFFTAVGMNFAGHGQEVVPFFENCLLLLAGGAVQLWSAATNVHFTFFEVAALVLLFFIYQELIRTRTKDH